MSLFNSPLSIASKHTDNSVKWDASIYSGIVYWQKGSRLSMACLRLRSSLPAFDNSEEFFCAVFFEASADITTMLNLLFVTHVQ